ncbi:hypothetical protein FB451DRAFT_630006 [Mycena latifolia]|nr:hypothetical protein FB451DRAFT_630006 [Mycena latifolia]
MDDNLILVAHPDIIWQIFLRASDLPTTAAGTCPMIQDLYQGSKCFEYLILPVDSSIHIMPRVLISEVPPHIAIVLSVAKLSRRCADIRAPFNVVRDSLVKLIRASPPSSATFTPNVHTFITLRYIHERWMNCYVPPPFLGLEESVQDVDVGSDSEDTESSYWEVVYIDEPYRRLLPHELEQDPAVLQLRWTQPVVDDDDDAISCDSQIPGADDQGGCAKTSLERADEADRLWLHGIVSRLADSKFLD